MVKNNFCDICHNKEVKKKVYDGIEICDDCFETISYVSRFKNIDNATNEEKNCISKFLNLIYNKLLSKE